MSDNKLLTENTIRRFMQLANTEAMTDSFLAENAPQKEKSPEEKAKEITKTVANNPTLQRLLQKKEGVEDEDTLEEDLEGLEEQEDEEMEIDAELDADMDAEPMDAEPEMGAADMSLTEEEAQLLISLGERLSAAMEGAGAEDAPVDDAPAMDDMEAPEGEEMEEPEAPGARYEMEENIDQDELVNEVLKRVTKRLVAAKLNRK